MSKRPYGQNTVPRSDDKAYRSEWRKRNPEKVRASQRRRYYINPERGLWRNARYRARKNNLEFTIKVSDIKIPKICPVLGIEITLPDGKRRDSSASVDRIDPTKGYTPSNTVVISWRANRMKNRWSLGELRKLVNWLESR